MKLRSALEIMEWYANILSKGKVELISNLVLEDAEELKEAKKKIREFINDMD